MYVLHAVNIHVLSAGRLTVAVQSNLPMETQAWMSFTWRIRVLAVPTTSSLGP
jgi:hypothetical protein